jgi:hypothetical protein
VNEMHFHCQACKKDQWLPEDCPRCSYCGSSRLWEIVEDEPLLDIALDRMNSFFLDKI